MIFLAFRIAFLDLERKSIFVKLLLGVSICSLTLSACGRKPASYWIQQLKEGGDDLKAVRELAEIGEPAVPPLIELLTYDEVQNSGGVLHVGASFYASIALKLIGKPAVPGLVKALKEGDTNLKLKAIDTLGLIGPQAENAVPALTEALCEGKEKLRIKAAHALGDVGKSAVPALVTALKSQDGQVRAWAVFALTKSGLTTSEQTLFVGNDCPPVPTDIRAEVKAVIPDLVEAMQGVGEDEQRDLLFALARMGSDATPAVPALIKALQQPSWYVRNDAAIALGNIGPAAEAAIPALVESLRTPSSGEETNVRSSSAEALGKIGGSAKSALPALEETWTTEKGELRIWTAFAIVQIGRAGGEVRHNDEAAFSSLVAALNDSDAEVRKIAAMALGEIGPVARGALPALRLARRDKDENVRNLVEVVLNRIETGK